MENISTQEIKNEKGNNINNNNNGKELFENKETLFEVLFPKNLFEDNKKSLFNDNDKELFSGNKNIFDDNNLFKTNDEFINNENLFEDYNIINSLENGKNKINSGKDKNNQKDDLKKNEDENGEESNDDEKEKNNEDENMKINFNIFGSLFNYLEDKEKKVGPKMKIMENYYLINHKEKCNSELISFMELNNPFMYYKDIKELKNGNIFILFEDEFYYISSKTFQIIKKDESLNKYLKKGYFLSFKEIKKGLIGIISRDFVLIVQYNKNLIKFFQEIEIKANTFESFSSENLLIFNVYDKENKNNTLYFYKYDEKLKYQLQSKDEIKINNNGEENVEDYLLYNYISNIRILNDGTLILFTQSSIPHEETQGFDANYMSFYERDYDLFLKIFLYDFKKNQLTKIYDIGYLEHTIYSECDYPEESEYGDFLRIFKDDNIFINFENNEFFFFNYNIDRLHFVNFKTKFNCCYLFKNKNNKKVKNMFYDKKKKYII